MLKPWFKVWVCLEYEGEAEEGCREIKRERERERESGRETSKLTETSQRNRLLRMSEKWMPSVEIGNNWYNDHLYYFSYAKTHRETKYLIEVPDFPVLRESERELTLPVPESVEPGFYVALALVEDSRGGLLVGELPIDIPWTNFLIRDLIAGWSLSLLQSTNASLLLFYVLALLLL